METQFTEKYRNALFGQEANTILRSCVHCGFCTATCPTFQLLGDELDGPRGRIYLIKQVLEGHQPSERTQLHLDRCLTCRSCESTCPSGVQYARLLDIGRFILEAEVPRAPLKRLERWVLRQVLPHPARLRLFVQLGQALMPLLPDRLKKKVPALPSMKVQYSAAQERQLLVLEGCAQEALTPEVNQAADRVLNRLGISLTPITGCCGAVSYHLAQEAEGLDFMRRNIDAWWPLIEQGAEAILVNASGCGMMIKDYGHALQHDKHYAERAQKLSAMTRDLSEVLSNEDLTSLSVQSKGEKVAFHSPCSLQHGQKLPGSVEGILTQLGFELTPVVNAHLCCGSSGTYSILQPEISERLLDDKLKHLTEGEPELITTANVGCQLHLQSGADRPVKHWIELIADKLDE